MTRMCTTTQFVKSFALAYAAMRTFTHGGLLPSPQSPIKPSAFSKEHIICILDGGCVSKTWYCPNLEHRHLHKLYQAVGQIMPQAHCEVLTRWLTPFLTRSAIEV